MRTQVLIYMPEESFPLVTGFDWGFSVLGFCASVLKLQANT